MILLLTGCITPEGMMCTALNNKDERKEQYIKAIRYYLRKTNYPIVFVENSNTDISYLFQEFILSGRLEYLTFCGNKDKNRGKGYGECEIIQYALDNSIMIHNSHDSRIVKITGRLIIKNIKPLIKLHNLLLSHRTVLYAINSNLTFPDSRIIIAPTDYYHLLLSAKDKINDSFGYYFEHALLDTTKRCKFPYSPFFLKPCIEGMSGSTGEVYKSEPYSISFALRYAKYALSQKKRFNNLFLRN